ncbi:carbohydrate sulfotransferase 15-like [Mizuhopecten yessoensis]|uniref:Carbohydrate sulfotransferase 15 n=1 Tax=Mizuhopecten yessoensis TaxID=6573 RepID=A0A210QCP5_MIZYE|nr:carbohydrate sulfotransferase 15-like [Mizuhopecten yessoensis]OWF46491.1 Carbohydrate sulfotransferase 15 [Mizuhopecten yessoensis]
MMCRKDFKFRFVSIVVIVILTVFSVYYFSASIQATWKHLPFVLTGNVDQSPSQTNFTGKYVLSFTSQGNVKGDQPPSLGNSTGKYRPFIPSGINDKQPGQVNSTGKDFIPFIPISRHDQPLHQDHQSAPYNTSTDPAKIDYRQRFLDYAKEDLLHTIPPTYLKQFKNPCWYENSTESMKMPTLRCLPYFMILGQNKCGTTALYMNVIKHPDVIASKGKEPQFWARMRHCYCCGDLTYRFRCVHNRPWTWKNYIEYFNPAAKKIQKFLISKKQAKVKRSAEIITGEATPSNLWDNRWWWNYNVNENDTEPPAVTNADYLHHFMPNLKMIIILRNPVSRLYSDYKYVSLGKKSPELFHQEVTKEINSFRNCSRLHDFRYCVFRNSFDERNVTSKARLNNGFYALFIEEYLKFYPREQFHIIRLEDYSKQNTEVMEGIFRFLNLRVPEKQKKPDKRASKVSKIGDMLPETKALITEFYKPYTEHLADLLKDERFLWRD